MASGHLRKRINKNGNVNITMNIYAHALQESDRKAATALENLPAKQA